MPVTLNSPIMKPASINANKGELQTTDANSGNGDFQKIFAKQVDQKNQDIDDKPVLQNAGADGNTLVKADAGQNALERVQPKAQSLQDAALKVEHGDKKKLAQHKKHDVKELKDDAKLTVDQQATAVDSDAKIATDSVDTNIVTDKKQLKKAAGQAVVSAENAKPQEVTPLLVATATPPALTQAIGAQSNKTSEDSDGSSLLDIAQQSTVQQRKSAKQDTLLAQHLSDSRVDKKADKNVVAETNANSVTSAKSSDTSNPVDAMQQQVDFNQAFEAKLAVQQAASQTATNIQAPSMVAATAVVNPAAAVEHTEITAKLGTDRWNAEVGQKVVWMVGAEQQSATLTLNPPDLGPVQVVIQVHNDKADTTFISQNPEVRQALQDGLSALRDMMASNGVQLGEANIHSHQQAHHQAQQHAKQAQHGQGSGAAAPEVFSAPAGTLQTYVSNGLVDTFA